MGIFLLPNHPPINFDPLHRPRNIALVGPDPVADDAGAQHVGNEFVAHKYFGDFTLTQFQGLAKPHSLTLDLGDDYSAGPLWLLLHGEVEYFSANSMYAASQAGVQAISPYVE